MRGTGRTSFFHVGEGAFLFSFLLTVALRVPLLQRARRGAVAPARLPQYLLALAELTVLYLAAADMVVKPSGIDTRSVRYGGLVLALGLLAAAAIAVRARKTDPANEVTGVPGWRIGGFESAPAAAILGPQQQNRSALRPTRDPISERGTK